MTTNIDLRDQDLHASKFIANKRPEDFLQRLRRVSKARSDAWGKGDEISELFHANELGGEAGELIEKLVDLTLLAASAGSISNITKKLYRERMGWRGSRATLQDLKDELGDVLICIDKLAAHYDIDLAEVTASKFDATSRAVGLDHYRLGDPCVEAAE
jgi:NTP pyrophosphatase (non-canonical NTP hydrolase)